MAAGFARVGSSPTEVSRPLRWQPTHERGWIVSVRVPAGVDGFRVGARHERAEQLAHELAAADGSNAVVYLVAEIREGDWLLGDEWVTQFDSLDEARAYASGVREPYRVGVLAVVQVDGGRLYPGGAC